MPMQRQKSGAPAAQFSDSCGSEELVRFDSPREAQANLGVRGKPLGVLRGLADFPRLLLTKMTSMCPKIAGGHGREVTTAITKIMCSFLCRLTRRIANQGQIRLTLRVHDGIGRNLSANRSLFDPATILK